jgi:hypothetical protein
MGCSREVRPRSELELERDLHRPQAQIQCFRERILPYSYFNATMGSTRMARRAGT